MLVVVITIVIGIGIFIVLTANFEINESKEFIITHEVEDSAVDQTIYTKHGVGTIIYAQQWNGDSWVDISLNYISFTPGSNVIVVDKGGLFS